MTRQADGFDPNNVSENEIYKFITAQWQHQNQLSWSRLYVMLALEFAALGGAFSAKGLVGSGAIIVGTFVGFILYRLMRRDWNVRDQHLRLLDKVHGPLGIRMIPPSGTRLNNGQFLLRTLFITLLATNVAVLAILFCQKTEAASLSQFSIQKCVNPAVHTDAAR